jgi:hypothetical protein
MFRRPNLSAALKSLFLTTTMLSCIAAQAQMVQDPIVTVYAGIPAATYNGTTPQSSICTTGVLDTFGDGCPATQAILYQPRGMYNDLQGNVFISDEGAHALRVVYKSGTGLAAALVAASPGLTFTPTPGNIYALGNITSGTPTLFTVGASCGAGTTAKALDTVGDGCPAQYADMHPLAVVVDPSDNIFFGDSGYPLTSNAGSSVHVVYVGGTVVANLIKAYNPTVTTPQVGSVYALSYTGGTNTTGTLSDFNNVSSIAVDSNDNLYAIDNGAVITGTVGTLATTDGLQVKKFVSSPVAGWTTFVQGGNGAVLGAANGDGGPYTAAKIMTGSGSFASVQCDVNGNLFIGDGSLDGVRVVYLAAGSVTPPLYVNGTGTITATTSTPAIPPPTITTPVVGDIYSVSGGLGGGSYRRTGIQASLWQNDYFNMSGMDQAGNLLTIIDGQLERTSITTGEQTIIGGVLTSTTTGTENPTPAAGATCSGATGGPTMTNAYGGGCPAMTVQELDYMCCVINADSQGNFYVGDYRSTQTGVIFKYSMASEFGSASTSAGSTQYVAFTPSVITYGTLTSGSSTGQSNNTFHGTVTYGPPNPTIVIDSTAYSTTDFSDVASGANDSCYIYASSSYNFEYCMYDIAFKPAAAGPRTGSLTVSSGGTVLDTVNLGGIGSAAQLSVDPGLQSTLGTGLTPGGAALDQLGNIYVSSGTTTGLLLKSTGGAFPASFATGFSSPKQVAIDEFGNIYVADSGNNRVALVTQAGAVSSYLATFTPATSTTSTSLSDPSGVAVDVFGNIYISDTGNSRVVEVGFAGNISIMGFTGLSAPQQLAVDSSGDVFVADSGNKRIVELTPGGAQSTVSVTPALSKPVGVALDPAGDLYIADSGNQNVVTVLPGSTTATTLLSSLTGLNGVLVDQNGDVFAASTGAGGLVEDNRTNTAFTYPTITPTNSTTAETLTLTDAGNAPLTIGNSLGTNSDSTDFKVVSATTNGCTINSSVAPGAQCNLSAQFNPQSTPLSGMFTETLTFPSYNALDAASVTLTGNTTFAQPTTTTITAATNPIAYGQTATLTITVAPTGGTTVVTGNVTLKMNGVAVSGSPFTLTPASSGLSATATFTVPIMVAGSYSFVATYNGAPAPGLLSVSTSTPPYVLVVNPAPSSMTTIAASGNPIAYGITPTLTIQVAPVTGSGVPQGQLTLTQNGVAVTGSPFTLSSTGTVTYTPSGLVPGNGVTGTYTYVATYLGTYSYAPSSGNLVEVVNPPPPDFTISLSPTTGTVARFNSIITTVTITPVQYSGYNLLTTLTCTGVPSDDSCTVVTGTVTPNGVSPITATVTLQTNSLVTSVRKGPSGYTLALGFFATVGLFGVGLGRRRRWRFRFRSPSYQRTG